MSLIARNFQRLALRRGNIRNGLYPNAATWATMLRAQNHCMGYRHREIYRRAWELGVIDGFTGSTNVARFRFRTGLGVSRLTYVLFMGLDTHNAGANPRIDIVRTISGGASSTSTFYWGLERTGTNDGPSQQYLTTGDASVTPSTVYEMLVTAQDYARLLSLCVYEQASLTVDEGTNYYNTHNPAASSPIYDADRQQLVVGANALWKQNRAATWHWHLGDGSVRTRSSATYISIIDNSTSGTPATSDYGFYLNPQYHNTISATTVPFELAVYGAVAAGSGTVRLIDSAGNTYGPATVNGLAGWYTAAINLPAASTFYTAQYAGDGVNSVGVTAISLIEYTP